MYHFVPVACAYCCSINNEILKRMLLAVGLCACIGTKHFYSMASFGDLEACDHVQLVRMEWPLELTLGTFETVIGPEDNSLEEGEKAWDVCVARGQIFATIHACRKARSRIQVHNLNGVLLRTITSHLFNEPNMMALSP